ncbi:hypothetical protein IL306_008945 [Fusarium sp. DS 682]|nr:hypothetical protein IL306_008945 [Fusarium sp. DS 682]
MARPKKGKLPDDPQADLSVEFKAQDQADSRATLDPMDREIKALVAENKLLKDSVADLRQAIVAKDDLIRELRRSRDAIQQEQLNASRNANATQGSQAMNKFHGSSGFWGESNQKYRLDDAVSRFIPNSPFK